MLEEFTLEAQQRSCVTLVVENLGLVLISLKKDTILGTADPVELIVNYSDGQGVGHENNHTLAQINHLSASDDTTRQQRLIEHLDLESAELSTTQLEKLEMIKKNSDVIAMCSDDGHSNSPCRHWRSPSYSTTPQEDAILIAN